MNYDFEVVDVILPAGDIQRFPEKRSRKYFLTIDHSDEGFTDGYNIGIGYTDPAYDWTIVASRERTFTKEHVVSLTGRPLKGMESHHVVGHLEGSRLRLTSFYIDRFERGRVIDTIRPHPNKFRYNRDFAEYRDVLKAAIKQETEIDANL